MTGTTPPGIEIDRDLAAPPGAVFGSWTDPEHFAQWFGGPQVRVPHEGLTFIAEPGRTWTARMQLPDGTGIDWAGEFLEVVVDRRLVLTITDRPALPQRAHIEVDLAPIPHGTRMHFTQETPGFSAEQQAGLLAGWESFIDELERVATGLPVQE